MGLLSLNCYLLDDDPRRLFTVKVLETENISILKKLIKEEKANTLKDVDASDLDIWKVDIPILNFQKNLSKIELVDDNCLSPLEELSDVFPALVSKRVHVLIRLPPVDKPGKFPCGTYDGKTLELTVT